MNYAAMRYVAETCKVKGAGRAILWAIAYRADRDTGECWAGQRRLADEAGVARSTVQLLLLDLLGDGELELVELGRGPRSDCYRIAPAWDAPDLAAEVIHNPAASGPTVGPVAGDTRELVDRSGGPSGPIRAELVDRSAELVDRSADVTGPFTLPLSSGNGLQGYKQVRDQGKGFEGGNQVVAAGSTADAAGGDARRIPPALLAQVFDLDPDAVYDPGTRWSGDSITLTDGGTLPNVARVREWLTAKSRP